MARSHVCKRAMQFIFTHGGVFPVLRGRRDEEAFRTAHMILGKGKLVVMYAEGGRSRSGELGEARPGVGRIALETGVPIVPTAIVGSAEVRNWRRLRFPKVTVQYGEPIRFEKVEDPTREQAQAAADQIFERVKQMYSGLQRNGRRSAVRAARRAARDAAAGAARRPAAS